MKNLNMQFDKAAIGISTLCLAHCLLLPLIITLLPVSASLAVGDERFHKLLIIGILPTSIIALSLGCHKHKHFSVFVFGIIGLLFLISTAVLGHDYLGQHGEKIATVIGSAFIVYSHFKNYSLCKSTDCHSDKHNCH